MNKDRPITEFLFYARHIDKQSVEIENDETMHISKVLRFKPGTRIQLTDGKGKAAWATIQRIEKHQVSFTDIDLLKQDPIPYKLHIAIAPTKNISRFEWFIEKATELGIYEVTPIITGHSERKNIRVNRLEKICITAMKQTRSYWKPTINEVVRFDEHMKNSHDGKKYIAHPGNNANHLGQMINFASNSYHILVGPEGGFCKLELEQAKNKGFVPVTLAKNRLRTETAGIVACHTVKLKYETNLNR